MLSDEEVRARRAQHGVHLFVPDSGGPVRSIQAGTFRPGGKVYAVAQARTVDEAKRILSLCQQHARLSPEELQAVAYADATHYGALCSAAMRVKELSNG